MDCKIHTFLVLVVRRGGVGEVVKLLEELSHRLRDRVWEGALADRHVVRIVERFEIKI